MKVITAIEDHMPNPGEVWCFLAGGITNCPEWQDKVIEYLKRFEDTDDLVIFNPRRKNFPIDDPNASQEQIKWEFYYLERMGLFSMYFSSGESDQPICMYELGRNLTRMQCDFPDDFSDRIIITVEDGYRRKNDVIIQTDLATDYSVSTMICGDFNEGTYAHASRIYGAYRRIVDSRYSWYND